MLSKILSIKIKENDQTVKICVRPATYDVQRKLKVVYAQMYRKLIQDGVATKSSMLDLLRKEGLWTEVEEDKVNKLMVETALLQSLLESIPDTEYTRQKETVIKLAKARNQLLELVQIKSEPLEYVAETIADDISRETYLVESTFYEDGRKYFANYNDFKERRDNEDVVKILKTFNEDLLKDSTKQLLNMPEYKWLTKHGLMSKQGEIQDDELREELAKVEVSMPLEVTVEPVVESPKE